MRHALGGVGGEHEAPGRVVLPDHVLEAGLEDRDLPGLQPLDLGGVDVDAEHVMADLGQHRALDKPDIYHFFRIATLIPNVVVDQET